MRLTRPLAGLLSAALLGLIPLATASPAAAANAPTRVTFTSTPAKATYGDPVYFQGSVEGYNGSAWGPVPAGTAYLQVSAAGGAWRNLAADTSPGYLYFPSQTARSNAAYRVVYVGGSSQGWTFSPSSSPTRTLKVRRDFNEKIKRLVFKGKMSPAYKRKKVVIQVKAGRWKKLRTIRTDRRSRWSIKLPATRKRTHFRAVVSGNRSFVKSVSRSAYTYRY